MTKAPEIIRELVELFDCNIKAYKSPSYKEEHLKHDFLNKFFAALGWDVYSDKRAAPQYRDVIFEDSIKVAGGTKAPDYCFTLSGKRMFFVEAKKPSVNIRTDIHPTFQLRRYAWSAKLPLSILTDFEEFAVYETRTRPKKEDKAGTGRIMYLTYKDYIDNWDEIASKFSYDAVVKGYFDRYAETTEKKRGTQEVDDEFLDEIESWRDMLAKNIALRNPDLSVYELNYTVQRTIDRIVFLRMCEDRGIERYGNLRALVECNNIYAGLCKLYKRADEKYNSGLFYFKKEKGRATLPDELTLILEIDDKVLKSIIKNLYYPDSPYEFSVLPPEILGNVYERFLGKVIRLTQAHRAKVEEKPEVKKAGGVYYTPQYIVEYIVKNTVGKLTEGKTPKQILELRILDPACGSGSFLLGAYTYLLNHHLEYYSKQKNPQRYKDQIYQGRGGEWFLTIKEKKRILLNNIYGVDIDPQAVEVTKLSLLLKVLEGESRDVFEKQQKLFQERALPDLENNIKCGNSLIGPNFYDSVQTKLFDEEEMYRINAFDWNDDVKGFGAIMKRGGFDCVIGNPPYGALITSGEIKYLNGKFKLQQYSLDTYLLFVEKALTLLGDDKLLGMIIPNTWLLNLMMEKIRNHIFNQTRVEEIVHYRHPVFPKATVDTEIVILRKGAPKFDSNVSITIVQKDLTTSQYEILQHKWQKGAGKPVNVFERPEYEPLVNKLSRTTPLDDLCLITQGTKPFQVGKGKPPQTRDIVNKKPFVSDIKKDDTFRPLLRGSLIDKWYIRWKDDYWISFGDWLAEPRYSANYDVSEKIVIRQTGDSLVATLDREQFIVRDNLYTIVPRCNDVIPAYILGLLNSCVLNWYYQKILNPELGEALAQVKRGHIAQLPIRTIDFSNPAEKAQHDKLVALVENMLELQKKHHEARIERDKELFERQIKILDKQIDKLVYELYGLTDEEIEIVEHAK